jgi:hypothetical protein
LKLFSKNIARLEMMDTALQKDKQAAMDPDLYRPSRSEMTFLDFKRRDPYTHSLVRKPLQHGTPSEEDIEVRESEGDGSASKSAEDRDFSQPSVADLDDQYVDQGISDPFSLQKSLQTQISDVEMEEIAPTRTSELPEMMTDVAINDAPLPQQSSSKLLAWFLFMSFVLKRDKKIGLNLNPSISGAGPNLDRQVYHSSIYCLYCLLLIGYILFITRG